MYVQLMMINKKRLPSTSLCPFTFWYLCVIDYDARSRSATLDRTRRQELRNTLSARFAPSTLRQACVKPASRRLSSIPRRYKIRSPLFAKMDSSRCYDSVFAIRLFFGFDLPMVRIFLPRTERTNMSPTNVDVLGLRETC